MTRHWLKKSSPGVDGPPIMPEDPYAYIMAAYQVPPSPDYIPGPEYMPTGVNAILPGRGQQPQPAATASPTADSPDISLSLNRDEGAQRRKNDGNPEEDPSSDYPS
ncbi:hypothetical protein Tco_0488165 [Tanacetum coccineum]